MASNTVPPAAAASCPVEGHAPHARGLDLEDRAFDACTLLDLAQWIEEARGAIAAIQMAVPHDEVLAGRLRAHRVRFMLDWTDSASAGLTRLLMTVRDDACKMAGVGTGARHG